MLLPLLLTAVALGGGNGLVMQHSRDAPFWVGVPQGWVYKDATYPSDHSTEFWRAPKDAKSRLDIEVSACVMCAQPMSCVLHDTGCGPAPQVIVPKTATQRKRLDKYRMSYVLGGKGYPEHGLVWVMHDKTGVIGFAVVRVRLPAAKAALAEAILASFRI